jgi:hypothetical protein
MRRFILFALSLLLLSAPFPLAAQQSPEEQPQDGGTEQQAPDDQADAPDDGEADDDEPAEWGEYQTLFEDFPFRGYGGPELKVAEIAGQIGGYMGGRGGLIFANFIGVGIGAYGLLNSPDDVPEVEGSRPVISVGYGGPYAEVMFFPASILHINAGALLGLGNVSYTVESENVLAQRADNGFFVVDLFGAVELNMTRFLQAGAGLGWRSTIGASLPEFEDSDLSSPTFRLYLKLGSF